MKVANKITLSGVVSTRLEASAYLRSAGDAVLVERGAPRLLLLLCPCGCGEELAVNLDSRAGPAWRLYRDKKRCISLFPSVWRDSGCRSHFIIWRNRVVLFGVYDDEIEADREIMPSLSDAIKKRLPAVGLVSFTDMAIELDAVPWDVLAACRRLVALGAAREGTGGRRSWFGRV